MTDVGWADSGFSVLCRTRCLIRDPAPVPGKESTPLYSLDGPMAPWRQPRATGQRRGHHPVDDTYDLKFRAIRHG